MNTPLQITERDTMPTEPITTRTGELGPVEVLFEVDENLDDAQARYGHEVVFSRYKAQLVIDLQAFIRTQMKGGKAPNDIQAAVDSWKPGVKAKGKSQAEKAEDYLSKLTPEQRAELLAKYS